MAMGITRTASSSTPATPGLFSLANQWEVMRDEDRVGTSISGPIPLTLWQSTPRLTAHQVSQRPVVPLAPPKVAIDHWLFPRAVHDIEMEGFTTDSDSPMRIHATFLQGQVTVWEHKGRDSIELSATTIADFKPMVPLKGSWKRLVVIKGDHIGKLVRRIEHTTSKTKVFKVCEVEFQDTKCKGEKFVDEDTVLTVMVGEIYSHYESPSDRKNNKVFQQYIKSKYHH